MTKQEYLKYFREFTDRMNILTKAKNDDYSAGVDPFANFTRVEALGICSTEQGFLTRMTDKLSRLSSFVQRGELSVKSESVEDTLMDLAVYSILFAAFLTTKRPNAPTQAVSVFKSNGPIQNGMISLTIPTEDERKANWIAP